MLIIEYEGPIIVNQEMAGREVNFNHNVFLLRV
jgi:hypothetical protein